MNHPASPEETVPLDAELVAYLDGELAPEHARRIEARLSQDNACRERLRQLQRTWDLLDVLPRAEANTSFTRSTIELVAQQVAGDVEKAQSHVQRLRRLTWLGGVAGVLAAALGGFLLGRSFWTTPDEELLRDLPVIENVEMYLQAGDIEFLRMLDSAQLFDEDPGHGK